MDKLISQQAAIEAFYQYPNINWTTLDVMEKIKELPTAEQDTTTHDSIPAETGKNDGDGTSGDCISRQAESNPLEKCYTCKHVYQRVSDADTLYCRCRKGCRYEEFKPKRSNGNSQWHEGEN